MFLTKTENQLKESYLDGTFYEICGFKNKKISLKTFDRDMADVIQELAHARQTELTTDEYNARVEKWKRRLELEISEAKSQKQIGVISNYLFKLMALDGISVDGIQTGGGNTYIFENNTVVLVQPEKAKEADKAFAEWKEIKQ